MLERIEKRGRSFEQVDDNPGLEDYYAQVHGEYPDWYENYHVSPKMKIDGNQLDFVQNPDDLKTVLEMVDTKLKELDLL